MGVQSRVSGLALQDPGASHLAKYSVTVHAKVNLLVSGVINPTAKSKCIYINYKELRYSACSTNIFIDTFRGHATKLLVRLKLIYGVFKRFILLKIFFFYFNLYWELFLEAISMPYNRISHTFPVLHINTGDCQRSRYSYSKVSVTLNLGGH